MGLASRVVAPEKLLDEALALALQLADVPAAALQTTKRALNAYLNQQLDNAYAIALSGELDSMHSEEHRLAVAAAQSKAAAAASRRG
jgi:enoyl-CoA hydratase